MPATKPATQEPALTQEQQEPVTIADGTYRMTVGEERETARLQGVYAAADVRETVATLREQGYEVRELEYGVVRAGYAWFELLPTPQEVAEELLPVGERFVYRSSTPEGDGALFVGRAFARDVVISARSLHASSALYEGGELRLSLGEWTWSLKPVEEAASAPESGPEPVEARPVPVSASGASWELRAVCSSAYARAEQRRIAARVVCADRSVDGYLEVVAAPAGEEPCTRMLDVATALETVQLGAGQDGRRVEAGEFGAVRLTPVEEREIRELILWPVRSSAGAREAAEKGSVRI